MTNMLSLVQFVALLLVTINVHGQEIDRSTHYLTTTAVTSSPEPPHNAQFQCWRFKTPFNTYPTVGMSVFLADASNVTYVVLPPRSNEGLHKPPHPM